MLFIPRCPFSKLKNKINILTGQRNRPVCFLNTGDGVGKDRWVGELGGQGSLKEPEQKLASSTLSLLSPKTQVPPNKIIR